MYAEAEVRIAAGEKDLNIGEGREARRTIERG
jgi:hypothetical protein